MPTICTTVARRDIPPNRRRGAEIRVVLGPATAGATSGFMGVAVIEPGDFAALFGEFIDFKELAFHAGADQNAAVLAQQAE